MSKPTIRGSLFVAAVALAGLTACGGSDGGGGNDGAGDAGDGTDGGGRAPFVPTGDPLTAPDLTWTWVDFPDTACRDGSPAGLGVSLNSASTKVMIYLQGGGACFNATTCGLTPANVVGQTGPQGGGLFDRTNPENPVKDWNFIYVPFCTGDVHAGAKDDGKVDGVAETQHFVGYLNVKKYLNRIVPTFPDATQVLLTGISAGGFGSGANADLVQWAFGKVPVTLLDDSGPSMTSQYITRCLQDAWRTTWGFDDSFLKDCGADCPDHSDYIMDYTFHLARQATDRPSGLIETVADGTITIFYGFGLNDCAPVALPTPMPADQFQAGLMDFRAKISAVDPAFGTYYIPGTQHTWLAGASIYSQTVGGTRMIDWITDIVNGTGATHVGP